MVGLAVLPNWSRGTCKQSRLVHIQSWSTLCLEAQTEHGMQLATAYLSMELFCIVINLLDINQQVSVLCFKSTIV